MQGRLGNLEHGSVYGLDLSLTATGIAAYRHGTGLFDTYLVKTGSCRSSSVVDRVERLDYIFCSVMDVIPDRSLVVVEAPAYRSQVGQMHERSGLWWIIVSWLVRRGCEVVEVAPATRAKYVTGSGRAGKKAVVEAVNSLYRLPRQVTNDNLADAVTLAAMGCRLNGVPVEQVGAVEAAVFEERLQVVRNRL